MNKTNTVFGLDMAPTHGALSIVKFNPRQYKPISVEPVAHFEKKDKVGDIFMRTHQTGLLLDDAAKRATWLHAQLTPFNLPMPVVWVDYTILGTAFMPSGKIYGAKWSFVMGAFFEICNNWDIAIMPLIPAKVRTYFRLNARARKLEVYDKFRQEFPEFYENMEVKASKQIRQDYLDASLLAIVGGA